MAKEIKKIREDRKQKFNPLKSQATTKPIDNVTGTQKITMLLNTINKRLEEQVKTNPLSFKGFQKLTSKIKR